MNRALLIAMTLAGGCFAPITYDRVLQKSTHNSYERDESLFDQLVYHRVRSLELDVQLTRGFAVYHRQLRADPNHTSCKTLYDCIDVLSAFHRATPLHEVVTVWLEPSDYETPSPPDFEYTASGPFPVADLENLVSRLPLFTPRDLIAACQKKTGATVSSLQQAAATCGFPTTDDLRGKFIFALMYGNDGEERALEAYLGPRKPSDVTLFVAPLLKNEKSICSDCAVLYDDGSARNLFGTGRVTRAVLDDNPCSDSSSSQWTSDEANRLQHIGTDCVNDRFTPWAVTHNDKGWPFECVPKNDVACTIKSEATDLIGVAATSNDLWGSSDDFVFAYETVSQLGASTLSAFIAAPSSHVDEWSKGCLMARASNAPDAAYFAICRPGDVHKVRVQYRTRGKAETQALELDVDPEKTAAFVQLQINPDGSRTCFTGSDSPDGVRWQSAPGASTCIEGTFPLQGLAVSAHGDSDVRMLFGNVRRARDGGQTAYSATLFPTVQWIGAGPPGRGRSWDGPIAP